VNVAYLIDEVAALCNEWIVQGWAIWGYDNPVEAFSVLSHILGMQTVCRVLNNMTRGMDSIALVRLGERRLRYGSSAVHCSVGCGVQHVVCSMWGVSFGM